MDVIRQTFKAFACPNEIQLDKKSAQNQPEGLNILVTEALRIEAKFSRYRADSVVSEINRAAGQRAVTVDAETASLLNFAAACHQDSNGLFDITSGVLRRVWDFKTSRVPSEQEIGAILPLIGLHQVKWDGSEIFLPRMEMEIDFGGFGKEYASDRLAALAQELGFKRILINLGGDIRVITASEHDEPFRIGVIHPRTPGAILTYVELRNGAVATSGDYERFFERGEIRYSHFLNPRTGWPVRGFQSVTVLSNSCLIAGAATTIAMLAGETVGEQLLKGSGHFYLAVKASGTLVKYDLKDQGVFTIPNRGTIDP